MINKGKSIVIDLDGTLCHLKKENEGYSDAKPNMEIVAKLREYKEKGFYIIVNSARNMRTFDGNLGKINAVTLKTILQWLDKHKIPYDEVYVGRPWCGFEGFYVDDQTVRPDEFLSKTYGEILKLTR
ncbi:MAG: HAD hydrolase family protein [Candidatus Woesearchaeota archaeon]